MKLIHSTDQPIKRRDRRAERRRRIKRADLIWSAIGIVVLFAGMALALKELAS